MRDFWTVRIVHTHQFGRAEHLFIELDCLGGITYDQTGKQRVVPIRNWFGTHRWPLRTLRPKTSISFFHRGTELEPRVPELAQAPITAANRRPRVLIRSSAKPNDSITISKITEPIRITSARFAGKPITFLRCSSGKLQRWATCHCSRSILKRVFSICARSKSRICASIRAKIVAVPPVPTNSGVPSEKKPALLSSFGCTSILKNSRTHLRELTNSSRWGGSLWGKVSIKRTLPNAKLARKDLCSPWPRMNSVLPPPTSKSSNGSVASSGSVVTP